VASLPKRLDVSTTSASLEQEPSWKQDGSLRFSPAAFRGKRCLAQITDGFAAIAKQVEVWYSMLSSETREGITEP